MFPMFFFYARDDSQLIQNIVTDVLHKLYLRYPVELKGIIGIDESCKHLELLLKRVRVVGIWGMGGIGKTTIAKVMLAKLFHQYDSVCFLENVREESSRVGLPSLRHKLVSQLLKEVSLASNVGGSAFITRRLNSQKFFIVLDDVDSFEQLQCLCGERDDIGKDVTLLITTRDRHLLTGMVDEIYKVKEWNFKESQELFCLNAFKERHPREGYEDLSDRAIHYSGGVPLALKVLGLHLCSRSREFWESTLNKLENYPNDKILNVLKVSYDGLDKPEKRIFLDIAFFFNHQSKDEVIKVLEACDFYATSGIEVLEDKALISVAHNSRIEMHDLLKEMGLNIVRQECDKNPGRRSRLRGNDAYDVLEKNKGTDEVEGIALDLSQIIDLHLSSDTFNRMPNLRFLQLYIPSDKSSCIVYHCAVLEGFSDKLKYLEWHGFPCKSLSPTFRAESLVQIRMPHSNVKELWQGIQDLVNLEGVELSECTQLIKLPDLSRASRLKWLNLSCCESLCDLHPSVLSLDTLVTLILDKCIKLKSVKSEKNLRSLRDISISGCKSLHEFSLSSDLIEYLDLKNTGAETLHISISHLTNLWRLYLVDLRVKNLPDELSCLTSLKELRICNCICLYELPNNIGKLSSLHKLTLDGSYVSNLPPSIVLLKKLEILSLRNCINLECLPELPPSIKELYLVNCICLYELPNDIGKLSSLYKLTLDGSCVSTLPASIVLLKKLQILSLRNCKNLECLSELPPSICVCLYELPNDIGQLSSLYNLTLDGSCVSSLPASIVLRKKLQILSLRNCRNLECLPELPPSIIELYLDNCICLYKLPNDIGKLLSLYKLTLDGSCVSTLPASIVLLKKLQILSLRNCRNLECLPELLPSISELYADNCTTLTTVYTLKAVAKLGLGYQCFSFKNCTKLDVHSLSCIMEGAQIAVKKATMCHVLWDKSSVMFCWPGSEVPRQSTYRTTKSFIVNKLPSTSTTMGFFFTVVLSCSLGTKNNEMGEIVCEVYLAYGSRVLSYKWRYEFRDLSSDHVFGWYQSADSDLTFNQEVLDSFEFRVFINKGEHDDSIVVKELGVQQLCVLGNDSFIEVLDLEFDKKVELQLMFGLLFDIKPMIKVLWNTYMIGQTGELKEVESESGEN